MQVTNQRGAAPLEIGNEFLFHCYLFPVPLPHNANPKRESKDKNGIWTIEYFVSDIKYVKHELV